MTSGYGKEVTLKESSAGESTSEESTHLETGLGERDLLASFRDVSVARSLASTTSDIGRVPTNKSILYLDPEQRPPIFKSTFQEYICVALFTFAPAAASMGSACFQTSLSVTSQYFGIDGGVLTWCVNSIMLANGGCMLLMGGIADALGRRNSLIIGFFSYALFSLIAGFMKNFAVLCILRALMGAAVACATPAAAGFLGSTYKDSKRKNMAMSIFALGSPVGGASGYIIAGVCIIAFNWRAVQYFLAILFGFCSIGVVLFMPDDETRMQGIHASQIFRHLDYGGSFISLAAFTLICFSLTQVDAATDGWGTPYIIALLVVGIVLIPVFVLYEMHIPSQPIMPMALFKSWNFDLCMIISTFSWINFQGVLNYYSIVYFEMIRGYSAILTACCLLPQPICGIFANIFAGLTMHKIPGRIFIFVGCLGFLIASIIWATFPIDRNYFLGPFWAFIVCVLGADFIYNVANRCSLGLVEKEVQSRAAGTFNTIIQLASSVGLGLSSTIVSSKYSLYGTSEQNDHKQEFWNAIRYAFYFGIALSGISLILSLFLRIGVIGAISGPDKDDYEEQHKQDRVADFVPALYSGKNASEEGAASQNMLNDTI
ncbi:hypothetical protein FOA43_003451 [Brettanomyces nanus]|uniref:Major facilitator superfamily (MFS) profile domain-containing protein n=1 Tax=Eeniella nana TaxID=13502 RepID=A0A875S6Y9_EENNA|nr:uncharacterized protein FOA43_003451 [Brettanomyces nanus]QPG76065.1 hypothetical protein FOA43_003451 [Brettanomyces nanus]